MPAEQQHQLYVAPSSFGGNNNNGRCNMTVQELNEQLRLSRFGSNKEHYLCYFREGKPPRCVNCNQLIGTHERGMSGGNCDDSFEMEAREPERTTRGTAAADKAKLQPAGSSTIEPSSSTVYGGGGYGYDADYNGSDDEKKEEPETKDNPTCFICTINNQLSHQYNKKEGDLETESPGPVRMCVLHPSKEVSTSSYHGDSGCCSWNERPAVRYRCDECGIRSQLSHPLMEEREKKEVERFWEQHADLKFHSCWQCSRVVCSRCVEKGIHTPAKSRFNHEDPQWRTSLFGCCGSCSILCNTLWCYANVGHDSSAFTSTPVFGDEGWRSYVIGLPRNYGLWLTMWGSTGWFPLIPVFWLLVYASDALCCLTNTQIRKNERQLYIRYGVKPHSTAELLCCRWCVYMRTFREAEARGFPQPTACSGLADLPNLETQYPSVHPDQDHHQAPRPRVLF